VLLQHLLKWQLQSGERSRSWRGTINVQRLDLEALLTDSPSLRRLIPERVRSVYPRAVEAAIAEMQLLQNPFPPECPFTAEQILDRDFLPGGI
jgi:hypothetical protein